MFETDDERVLRALFYHFETVLGWRFMVGPEALLHDWDGPLQVVDEREIGEAGW